MPEAWKGGKFNPSFLFGRGDSGDDPVHHVPVGAGARRMVADHDGEDDGAAAGAVEVAAQGARLAECACLGEYVVFEWRLGEALGERAVLAAHGQGGAPGREPGRFV